MDEHAAVHIASAVVFASPDRCEDVADRIAGLPDTEIHGFQDGKIIVVLEGASVGAVGSRLTTIAGMDGVLSATLVYERIASLEELGDS